VKLRFLPVLVLSTVASLSAAPITATTGDLGHNVIYDPWTFSVDLNLTTPSNTLPATLTVKYGMWNGSEDNVGVILNGIVVGNFLTNNGYVKPGPLTTDFDVTGLLQDGANTVSFIGEPEQDYVIGQVDLAYDNSGDAPGVPEPSTFLFVCSALPGIMLLRRKKEQ